MPRRARLGLILGLLLPGIAAAGPGAEFLGSFVLTDPAPYLGGLSGLEFSADGSRFTALSDSAAFVTGRVARDAAGAITDIALDGPPVRLQDEAGRLLDHPRDDSEGLAYAGGERFLISFELIPRVTLYTPSGEVIRTLPIPQQYFPDLIPNAGLEALAVAPDGAIYAIPEGDAAGSASLPVFRFAHGAWTEAFTLTAEKTFRPVGADFGPDGRLYLLERDFWPLLGFRSRLRRIAADGSGAEVLFETPAGRHGNLEGLSIWTDAGGARHATMVSDNNFLPLSTTEFTDYRLPD